MIKPSDAAQIAHRIERTFKDVAFYNGKLVFCDLIEIASDSPLVHNAKDKSDWVDFDGLEKVDAELYLYNLVPEIGGVFQIHARQYTNRKKGVHYKVIAVIDRTLEGFGFVCALKDLNNG